MQKGFELYDIAGPVYITTCESFDNLVEAVYGQCYDSCKEEGMKKGSDLLFRNITGKLTPDDQKKVDAFRKSGDGNRITRILLEDLCGGDFLLKANYILSVPGDCTDIQV